MRSQSNTSGVSPREGEESVGVWTRLGKIADGLVDQLPVDYSDSFESSSSSDEGSESSNPDDCSSRSSMTDGLCQTSVHFTQASRTTGEAQVLASRISSVSDSAYSYHKDDPKTADRPVKPNILDNRVGSAAVSTLEGRSSPAEASFTDRVAACRSEVGDTTQDALNASLLKETGQKSRKIFDAQSMSRSPLKQPPSPLRDMKDMGEDESQSQRTFNTLVVRDLARAKTTTFDEENEIVFGTKGHQPHVDTFNDERIWNMEVLPPQSSPRSKWLKRKKIVSSDIPFASSVVDGGIEVINTSPENKTTSGSPVAKLMRNSPKICRPGSKRVIEKWDKKFQELCEKVDGDDKALTLKRTKQNSTASTTTGKYHKESRADGMSTGSFQDGTLTLTTSIDLKRPNKVTVSQAPMRRPGSLGTVDRTFDTPRRDEKTPKPMNGSKNCREDQKTGIAQDNNVFDDHRMLASQSQFRVAAPASGGNVEVEHYSPPYRKNANSKEPRNSLNPLSKLGRQRRKKKTTNKRVGRGVHPSEKPVKKQSLAKQLSTLDEEASSPSSNRRSETTMLPTELPVKVPSNAMKVLEPSGSFQRENGLGAYKSEVSQTCCILEGCNAYETSTMGCIRSDQFFPIVQTHMGYGEGKNDTRQEETLGTAAKPINVDACMHSHSHSTFDDDEESIRPERLSRPTPVSTVETPSRDQWKKLVGVNISSRMKRSRKQGLPGPKQSRSDEDIAPREDCRDDDATTERYRGDSERVSNTNDSRKPTSFVKKPSTKEPSSTRSLPATSSSTVDPSSNLTETNLAGFEKKNNANPIKKKASSETMSDTFLSRTRLKFSLKSFKRKKRRGSEDSNSSVGGISSAPVSAKSDVPSERGSEYFSKTGDLSTSLLSPHNFNGKEQIHNAIEVHDPIPVNLPRPQRASHDPIPSTLPGRKTKEEGEESSWQVPAQSFIKGTPGAAQDMPSTSRVIQTGTKDKQDPGDKSLDIDDAKKCRQKDTVVRIGKYQCKLRSTRSQILGSRDLSDLNLDGAPLSIESVPDSPFINTPIQGKDSGETSARDEKLARVERELSDRLAVDLKILAAIQSQRAKSSSHRNVASQLETEEDSEVEVETTDPVDDLIKTKETKSWAETLGDLFSCTS